MGRLNELGRSVQTLGVFPEDFVCDCNKGDECPVCYLCRRLVLVAVIFCVPAKVEAKVIIRCSVCVLTLVIKALQKVTWAIDV
jgi:hypothetical protein